MYLRLIHVDVWQKPTHNYTSIILQLKINLKVATKLYSSDFIKKR